MIIQRVNYITILRKMNSHRQITNELIDQEEIHTIKSKTSKERKTVSEMKIIQRYLSSINKGTIVDVLDLPAAVLDHLLAKYFFKISENVWRRL